MHNAHGLTQPGAGAGPESDSWHELQKLGPPRTPAPAVTVTVPA